MGLSVVMGGNGKRVEVDGQALLVTNIYRIYMSTINNEPPAKR